MLWIKGLDRVLVQLRLNRRTCRLFYCIRLEEIGDALGAHFMAVGCLREGKNRFRTPGTEQDSSRQKVLDQKELSKKWVLMETICAADITPILQKAPTTSSLGLLIRSVPGLTRGAYRLIYERAAVKFCYRVRVPAAVHLRAIDMHQRFVYPVPFFCVHG